MRACSLRLASEPAGRGPSETALRVNSRAAAPLKAGVRAGGAAAAETPPRSRIAIPVVLMLFCVPRSSPWSRSTGGFETVNGTAAHQPNQSKCLTSFNAGLRRAPRARRTRDQGWSQAHASPDGLSRSEKCFRRSTSNPAHGAEPPDRRAEVDACRGTPGRSNFSQEQELPAGGVGRLQDQAAPGGAARRRLDRRERVFQVLEYLQHGDGPAKLAGATGAASRLARSMAHRAPSGCSGGRRRMVQTNDRQAALGRWSGAIPLPG